MVSAGRTPRADRDSALRELLQDGGVVGVELATLDLHTAHTGERCIAIGVEAPLAKHAVKVLSGEDAIKDGSAIFLADLIDRVQRHIHGLITIDRIDLRLT